MLKCLPSKYIWNRFDFFFFNLVQNRSENPPRLSQLITEKQIYSLIIIACYIKVIIYFHFELKNGNSFFRFSYSCFPGESRTTLTFCGWGSQQLLDVRPQSNYIIIFITLLACMGVIRNSLLTQLSTALVSQRAWVQIPAMTWTFFRLFLFSSNIIKLLSSQIFHVAYLLTTVQI